MAYPSPSRLAIAALLVALAGLPAAAQSVPAHDNLNATLWMQRSVEYKAAAASAFALARLRLDQALADPEWNAVVPAERSGAAPDLPPAVILDIDETLLDNSGYQAWMVMNDRVFEPPTWTQFVGSQSSTAIEGALDFAKYADSKGVKVFYVSNRTFEEEPPTRQNMEKLGFPMGGNVDTFLSARKRPDWGSAKGTRRAFVAREYRVLLNVGDNFGDFVDGHRASEADRLKVYEEHRERWGRDWIMIANPSYGSFETAPYEHNFKLPPEKQREMKRSVLQPWKGP